MYRFVMRGLPQPVSHVVVLSSVLPMLTPRPICCAACQAVRSFMGAASAAPAHSASANKVAARRRRANAELLARTLSHLDVSRQRLEPVAVLLRHGDGDVAGLAGVEVAGGAGLAGVRALDHFAVVAVFHLAVV